MVGETKKYQSSPNLVSFSKFHCLSHLSYLLYFYFTQKERSFTNLELLQVFFLSLRVFGLLSSSLLLFPQRFGRYVFRPSSGVCRTREPTRNFELRTLLQKAGGHIGLNVVEIIIIKMKAIV